jgi:hypothetical protein
MYMHIFARQFLVVVVVVVMVVVVVVVVRDPTNMHLHLVVSIGI